MLLLRGHANRNVIPVPPASEARERKKSGSMLPIATVAPIGLCLDR